MKTITLDNNTGSFSVTELLRIELDGQDMINMGWEIEDHDPEDVFALEISDTKIKAYNPAYCTDTGFTFDYIDSIQDLIRHGYLMIADEEGNEAESGILQIKP